MTRREFGPYFVLLSQDGSIICPRGSADPYVFDKMGPHDNHTKRNERVVRAMIVVEDYADNPQGEQDGM